jgi:hypothetical protein
MILNSAFQKEDGGVWCREGGHCVRCELYIRLRSDIRHIDNRGPTFRTSHHVSQCITSDYRMLSRQMRGGHVYVRL